jgi:hypothetical protein
MQQDGIGSCSEICSYHLLTKPMCTGWKLGEIVE